MKILDMVVAEGPSAIFKISLALLKAHKVELMKLEGFEQVADYIKNQMNSIDTAKIRNVLAHAADIDLGKFIALKSDHLVPWLNEDCSES